MRTITILVTLNDGDSSVIIEFRLNDTVLDIRRYASMRECNEDAENWLKLGILFIPGTGGN